MHAGLSMAYNGTTLLYQLGDPAVFDPDNQDPQRQILYGLDPNTGAIQFQVPGLQTTFGPDGISWESRGGSTFTFINHANPIPDIHRFENIEMPGMSIEQLFWGPTQGPDFYHSVGGLGGDGIGREFGVFLDSQASSAATRLSASTTRLLTAPFSSTGSWRGRTTSWAWLLPAASCLQRHPPVCCIP